jgi:DNA-binding HxlR family transcriptional regulator
MAPTDISNMACPVARSMAMLGERWAILLMREAYYGSTRFDEFERHLGIAPNILSARLKTLVSHGLLEKSPAPGGGARHIYTLTQMGRDFFPVYVSLKQWAERWLADEKGPPTIFEDKRDGGEIVAGGLTRPDGSTITADDLRVRPGPGAGRYIRARFGEGEASVEAGAGTEAIDHE